MLEHADTEHSLIEAKRNPVHYRYDILDPAFLHAMAEIAHYGAVTYGEFNWQNSRLAGDKAPVNHIYKHLGQYRSGEKYDHLNGARTYHLAAIAFNAMMEFYWARMDEAKG